MNAVDTLRLPRSSMLRELNATALVATLVAVAILLPTNPVSQVTFVVGLIGVIGSTFGARLAPDGALGMRIGICAGVGLLGAFCVGAVSGLLLPHLGIARPLSGSAITVIWIAILAGVAIWCQIRRVDPLRVCLKGVTPRDTGWVALLCIPPALALLGVVRLNSASSGAVAVAVGLLVLGLVGLAIVLPPFAGGPPRVLLLMSALITGAWQTPMRGGWLAGGDIQHEYFVASLTVRDGRFPIPHLTDAYAGMLSLTVWPAMLHQLTGMSLRVALALIPVAFLSLALLVTWTLVREHVSARIAAVLCAAFVLGSPALLQEYPGVTRECYATLFFALLVLSLTSTSLRTRDARALAVIAAVGTAVSHYSTAYVTMGAVLTAWVLALFLPLERQRRVLTTWVVAIDVGITILWGSFLAHTGGSFRQIGHDISKSGLQFLPGQGNILTKWLHASAAGVAVTAGILRKRDLILRRHQYSWLHTAPTSAAIPLSNDPTRRAHGLHALGLGFNAVDAITAELIVGLSVVSVIYCLWTSRRQRHLVCVAGIGLFALVASAVLRNSATIAAYYGPERLQVQAYLVFIVTAAVAIGAWARSPRIERAWSSLRRAQATAWVGAAAICMVFVAYSTGLVDFVVSGDPLVMAYSSSGEQIELQPTPSDQLAGAWLASRDPSGIVQSDFAAQSVLYSFGFADRAAYVTSIDPVLLDTRSWVLAYHANVVDGRAFGGTTTYLGSFRFPRSYLLRNRPVLYSSATDLVFGPALPTAR